MGKKKEEEAPAGSPAWMATFSDLMNLLLCFFVLLFSMSSTDAAKFEMVVNSLKSAFSVMPAGGSTLSDDGALIGGGIAQLPGISNYFGDSLSQGEGEGETDSNDEAEASEESGQNTAGASETKTDTEEGENTEAGSQAGQDTENGQAAQQAEGEQSGQTAAQGEQAGAVSDEEALKAMEKKELTQSEEMAQNIEKLTQQYGIQDLVEIDFNGQYVRVTLNGALLFESGSADLSEEAKPLVEKMGKIIDVYDNNIVEVEGHTDNVPIHSSRFESNDVLSMYRALSVADYLREFTNVPPENIVSSGRGAYLPVADNSTPEGRARNRRVEIKIFNEINSSEAVEE